VKYVLRQNSMVVVEWRHGTRYDGGCFVARQLVGSAFSEPPTLARPDDKGAPPLREIYLVSLAKSLEVVQRRNVEYGCISTSFNIKSCYRCKQVIKSASSLGSVDYIICNFVRQQNGIVSSSLTLAFSHMQYATLEATSRYPRPISMEPLARPQVLPPTL
jgi:hypothetical protein